MSGHFIFKNALGIVCCKHSSNQTKNLFRGFHENINEFAMLAHAIIGSLTTMQIIFCFKKVGFPLLDSIVGWKQRE
jgi:hypothetical protein